jgi:hypothetical protein
MQAAAIDDLAGRSSRQVTDRRKSSAADADIAGGLPVLIDDGATPEQKIKRLSHMRNFRAHSVEVQRFAAPWPGKSQHLHWTPGPSEGWDRHASGCQLVNFDEITTP